MHNLVYFWLLLGAIASTHPTSVEAEPTKHVLAGDDQANELLSRGYRQPFAIQESV